MHHPLRRPSTLPRNQRPTHPYLICNNKDLCQPRSQRSIHSHSRSYEQGGGVGNHWQGQRRGPPMARPRFDHTITNTLPNHMATTPRSRPSMSRPRRLYKSSPTRDLHRNSHKQRHQHPHLQRNNRHYPSIRRHPQDPHEQQPRRGHASVDMVRKVRQNSNNTTFHHQNT